MTGWAGATAQQASADETGAVARWSTPAELREVGRTTVAAEIECAGNAREKPPEQARPNNENAVYAASHDLPDLQSCSGQSCHKALDLSWGCVHVPGI